MIPKAQRTSIIGTRCEERMTKIFREASEVPCPLTDRDPRGVELMTLERRRWESEASGDSFSGAW